MRRGQSVLWWIIGSSSAVVAASCALNAGGIVYVVEDGGGAVDAASDSPLADAPINDDGSPTIPDGAPNTGRCASDQIDFDGGFCVDRTEVTNASYVAFLEATNGDAGRGFAPCATALLEPATAYELVVQPNYPVRAVSWCAARAYCEWAGKRLCGSIADGGEVTENDQEFKDASSDEWFSACSANGAKIYPYGNAYDGGICNDTDAKEGGVVNVGSFAGCNGGYVGVADMSGNVWEWQNSCADDTTPNALCRLSGGAFDNDITMTRCDVDYAQGRTSNNPDFGIRCCSALH